MRATEPAASSSARADLPPEAGFEGWFMEVHETVDTTNRLASALPAWHAVRADTQTAGRGRTGRVWTSDRGGLWLSAVVPCPGPRERWANLPLAAGQALIAALFGLGVSGLRLRWPNDLLVGPRKLAGLLVERHSADTAVVGVGINVFNDPERADPALRDATTRLADLAHLGDRDLDDLASLVLHALARAHARLLADDFAAIAAELNRAWSEPRLVSLLLAGQAEPAVGCFLGIDEAGRLRLRDAAGAVTLHDPTQVALLREI
jgi:BirA family biotin operon repressor/biotin-[acetyl-CoA-carboxylase] ligase